MDLNQNIEIEYKKGKIIVKKFIGLDKKIKPSTEDWVNFWLNLDNLDIWNWNSDYDNFNVLDGYSWDLTIISGSKSIESRGSNAIPSNFKEFLLALELLIKEEINNLRY